MIRPTRFLCGHCLVTNLVYGALGKKHTFIRAVLTPFFLKPALFHTV